MPSVLSTMVQFHSDDSTFELSNGDLSNGFHKAPALENGFAGQAEAIVQNGCVERQQSGRRASTSDRLEPLLAENDDRFTFFPIKCVRWSLPAFVVSCWGATIFFPMSRPVCGSARTLSDQACVHLVSAQQLISIEPAALYRACCVPFRPLHVSACQIYPQLQA